MSTEEMDIYQQLMGKWLPSVKLCTYIILPSRAQMLTEQEEKYLFDWRMTCQDEFNEAKEGRL